MDDLAATNGPDSTGGTGGTTGTGGTDSPTDAAVAPTAPAAPPAEVHGSSARPKSGRSGQTLTLLPETAVRLFQEHRGEMTTLRAVATGSDVPVGNAHDRFSPAGNVHVRKGTARGALAVAR
ncbi:hypothetical protein [Kitasatospora sp. NPDC056181]|uniref:hypothetical protein n=1 Tax=Kitasatospora sp. NPDC056181 TaxID=3345737 RepID=UPI0035DC6CB1